MPTLRRAVALLLAAGALGGCGAGSPAGAPGGQTFDLTAVDLAFTATDIKLAPGEVTFVVKNADPDYHNLTIFGAKVYKDVGPHKTVKVKVNLVPGTYPFRCEYHPDTMKGTIVVS